MSLELTNSLARTAMKVSQASALFAVLAIGLSGCGQHGQAGLPATPALSRAADARAASGISQSVKFEFPSPVQFDSAGFSSSVAFLTPSTLVEEHQEKADLYYRFGSLIGGGITWGTVQSGGYGQDPSIATSGSTIVDVHDDLKLGLTYRVGTISGTTIAWGKTTPYDNGVDPHVAFSGTNTLVEVHSGGNGALWYHIGTIDRASKTIDFHGNAVPLDNGYYPSIATNGSGMAIELHAGSKAQWYHIGRINTTTHTIDWGTTSHEVPQTTASHSSVSWSPEGYIVITYICTKPYPFNISYLCSQVGSLDSNNTTVSW